MEDSDNILSASFQMTLIVIINPACGDRSAPSFFNDHVCPLLKAHNISVHHTLQTTSQDHAPSFISQFHDQPLTVILGSGDGTLQEIINKVSSQPIHFVLVPCGTGNALYSSFFLRQEGEDQIAYRLQSLLAFINRKPPSSLSLATTIFSSSSQITLSAVVVSTSLHASILHHSESLRDQYPSVERSVLHSAFPKRREDKLCL